MKQAKKKQKYFWFSGFGNYSKEGTGDGDYVKQMVAILQSKEEQVEWIKSVNGVEERELPECKEETIKTKQSYEKFCNNQARKAAVSKIIQHIEENSKDCDPVFHLTIRAPETGYIITPQDLLEFKKAGIKVVVTCHEYALNKFANRKEHYQSSLAYFQNADQVIFVNQKSRNAALKDCETFANQKFLEIPELPYPSKASLKQKSSFCPITATVKPEQEQTDQEILLRSANILVFGNFRRLKGFEEAKTLGKMIHLIKKGNWEDQKLKGFLGTAKIDISDEEKKQTLQTKLQDTKIIFAGSINPSFPDIYRRIAQASLDFPDSIKLHPSPTELGLTQTSGHTTSLKPDSEISAAATKPSNNISEEDLEELSKQCRYAYKGDNYGIRDNASGILSSMAQGCITFCNTRENVDTDDAFLSGEWQDSFIKASRPEDVFVHLLQDDNIRKAKEATVVVSQKKLLQERFGSENICKIHSEVYQRLEEKELSAEEKAQKDLTDLNLLFDLVAGPSHHRNTDVEGKKAKVKKEGDTLIFTNPNGRTIHTGLVPFVLGFDKIKDKKCFVGDMFHSQLGEQSFHQFCISRKQLLLGVSNPNATIPKDKISTSPVESVRDATQLLLKRELEEVLLSHIADAYYTRTQKMLPEAEHYSDNALKATKDRIGFDFDVKITGDGKDQKIELTVKEINQNKCQELFGHQDLGKIRESCFGFLKTTLCGEVKPELIQDKSVDSKAIPEDNLSSSESTISINSTVEEVTKKLWYERIPYAALVNIGPNGTILLLEHLSTRLELGGGRGGTPYHPRFSAMAETQGEICAVMKKGSSDLIPLSGFYKKLHDETMDRMNGDCFYAPWGTWQAKDSKIQDPADSNREFTNNHQFTKCWSFADLRLQASQGKTIRKAFDGIACYLSKKEEEIYKHLKASSSGSEKAAVIICGSKKTTETIFGKDDQIGRILIKKSLIEEAKLKAIIGDKITIKKALTEYERDYYCVDELQPEQLVAALGYHKTFGKTLPDLSPAKSYDAHEFSKIANEQVLPCKFDKNTPWKCSDTNFQATPSTTIKATYCKPLAPENLVIGTKTITQYWNTTSANQVIAQRANNFRAASIYDLRNGGENSEAVKVKGEIIQTHLDVILIAANEAKKDDISLSHDEVLEVIKFAKENGGVLNTQKPNAQQAESWMVDFSRIYQEKMKESGIFTGRQVAYKAVGSRLTFLPAEVLEKIQKEEFKGKFAGEVKTEAVKEATRRIADKAKEVEKLTRRTGAGAER